jgi:phosphatidylserine decarboxylase
VVAQQLQDWVDSDVSRIKQQPLQWITEQYFFRDPSRPMYADASRMFSPADGIILYQNEVTPAECIVDIKGKSYSLHDAMRDSTLNGSFLVIGIFMTMYDVHINRIPYSGYLSYGALPPITTLNCPMLDVERSLVEELCVCYDTAHYLHSNQRMINRIWSPLLQRYYYVLQIADYDVSCIAPFNLSQNVPVAQTQRFSQIRFGSQVDLIVPLADHYRLRTIQEPHVHVEAGVDPLIAIERLV